MPKINYETFEITIMPRVEGKTYQVQALGTHGENGSCEFDISEIIPKNGALEALAPVPEDGSLSKNQIRYFRSQDQDLAEQIKKELENKQIFAETKLVTGYEDNPLVRPKQFEIWFTTAPIPEIKTDNEINPEVTYAR